MSLDHRFFRPLGVLAIFAADPMIEAGLMAAGSFLRDGDYFRLLVSALSIVAAVLLLAAGILLCFKRIAGRTVAYAAASLSVPIAVFSAAMGLMGGHALMYGAGYPIAIAVLLKRATPSNGVPTAGWNPEVRRDAPRSDAELRTAIACPQARGVHGEA